MAEIDDPPNEKPIEILYAFLSEDADGNNGICAGVVSPIGAQILVTATERLLPYFMPAAKDLATRSGMTIKLYRFVRDECVGEIAP